MAARTLLDQEIDVHYAQLYVKSGGDYELDLHEAFTGQTNGLCGAAKAGSLYLITGLRTGNVGFTVEHHDQPPPLDNTWEDIVEASFTPTDKPVTLVHWASEEIWDLDLPVADYRVRYCAVGMDAAQAQDTRLPGKPILDRYLLQFWPAPAAPERIIKQTSSTAAYWHEIAAGLSAKQGVGGRPPSGAGLMRPRRLGT